MSYSYCAFLVAMVWVVVCSFLMSIVADRLSNGLNLLMFVVVVGNAGLIWLYGVHKDARRGRDDW